jgi:hypothetical protein
MLLNLHLVSSSSYMNFVKISKEMVLNLQMDSEQPLNSNHGCLQGTM